MTTPNPNHPSLSHRIARSGLRLETLLAVLWAGELVHLAFPSHILANILTPGLIVYMVFALAASRWQTLALCGALLTVILALCFVYGVWSALWPGFQKAQIFLAFLPTAMLIRSTADQRPEIANTRTLFASLPRAERDGGLLIGCHVIGSVLSVGIFSLLAPIAGPNATEDERRHLIGVGLRGMCLAAIWSPFFVSMALASEYLPGVPLWQIMPAGFALAIVDILCDVRQCRGHHGTCPLAAVIGAGSAQYRDRRGRGGDCLRCYRIVDIAIPGHERPASLRPGSSALGRAKAITACRSTYHGLGNLGGEIGILTFSVILGVVFKASLTHSGLASELGLLTPSPLAVIAVTIGGMCVAGFFGIHPIVSATVILVLVANLPHNVTDLALMMEMLTGWGLAAMISISGISVVLSSALFQVPPERLIMRQNLILVGVFGSIAIVLIALVNSVLSG